MRILKAKRTFRKEFKRQIKYAVAAAVGFMIAFVWKDALLKSSEELVDKFLETARVSVSSISTAVFVTILGVLVILITSRLLRD